MTAFDRTSLQKPDGRAHVSFEPLDMSSLGPWQKSCATRSIHQDPAWLELNPSTSQQEYLPFTVTRDGVILSAGHIRLRCVLKGYYLAAIQRGPVVADYSALRAVVPALEAALRAKGVVTLTVNPYMLGPDAEHAQAALEAMGFAVVPQELQNFPTITAMIDTAKDEAEILSSMSQTGRRHLRKAIKAGVITRPMASLDQAVHANEIMAQMAQETGLILDSQHDFTLHFKYLMANPTSGSILVTQVDDHIFGAAVNYMEGSRGYNMLLTTSSDVSVPRAYVLMWDSIKAARTLGATVFDMVGFPDERTETDSGMQSRGAFKRGFGPDIVQMLPLMSKPLRPGLHTIIEKARSLKRIRQKAKAGIS